MVKKKLVLCITKVKKQKPDSWARIEYTTKQSPGCIAKTGGSFNCVSTNIVVGQTYVGHIITNGQAWPKLDVVPQCRISHGFRATMYHAGIRDPKRRQSIIDAFDGVHNLMECTEEERWDISQSIRGVGQQTLQRMNLAVKQFNTTWCDAKMLAKHLPTVHRRTQPKDLSAALKWMKYVNLSGTMSERLFKFLTADPWRILYDTEYDNFKPMLGINLARSVFLERTSAKSRATMVESALQDLGISDPVNDPRYHRYCVIRAIKKQIDSDSSLWVPVNTVLSSALPGGHPIPSNTPIVFDDYVVRTHITLNKYEEIEQFVRNFLLKLKTRGTCISTHDLEKRLGGRFDATQISAIRAAIQHPVSCIVGYPGTGKSTLAEAIATTPELRGIILSAPTGKATERLKERTGFKSVYTVHRLVYMKNPPPAEVLLIDEASMLGLQIFAHLLHKLQGSLKHIVFIGDPDQLPSVSPGQLLRDLICCGKFPVTRLTTIYRQGPGSCIAINGSRIRNGRHDFKINPASFVVNITRDVCNAAIQAAKHTVAQGNPLPIVICSTNKEVVRMMSQLRELANPLSDSTETTQHAYNLNFSTKDKLIQWKHRKGDRVMNIRNKYELVEPEKEELYSSYDDRRYTGPRKCLKVPNGAVGTIVSLRYTKEAVQIINVAFDNKTLVEYNGFTDICEYLRPAYAATVYKAQGDEYPVVFVCTNNFSSWKGRRERLYTAVTRAQHKCIIFSTPGAISGAVADPPINRISYLF